MLLLTLDLFLNLCPWITELKGAEVFHAIGSCHQWSAGSVVPVLVRRMQFSFALLPVNFMPLHIKCGELWLECSARVVTPWACMSFMCFNLPFNKFEVCKQSATERCYFGIHK